MVIKFHGVFDKLAVSKTSDHFRVADFGLIFDSKFLEELKQKRLNVKSNKPHAQEVDGLFSEIKSIFISLC